MILLLYIFIFALLLLGVIFCITGKMLLRSEQNFKQDMKFGQAEVVGYDREEESSWYSLVVRLYEDGKIYNCKSKKSINTGDYPKGKIVDVIYARKKITGWYDVRLNEPDKLPENYSAVAKGFSIAGIMCLTSAIAIFCICLKLTLL